jgi:hypothetical protein
VCRHGTVDFDWLGYLDRTRRPALGSFSFTTTTTMIPTEILPHSVNLILQYISPPSQLSIPLPPYLISKDLLKRHHFLQPDTPEAYLCWPSIDQQRTIALLEALRVDDDQSTSYSVRYVSDDQTYAHIAITSGLRLIFQWDALEGWKYHDAKLMPFPPGCHLSAQAAFSVSPPVLKVPEVKVHDDAAEDDAYWNSYDREGDHEESSRIPGLPKDESQNDTEDAYWAQYATVQGKWTPTNTSSFTQHKLDQFPGSADSTVPSPRQKHVHPGSEEPLVFSRAAIHPSAHFHLDPPSPNTLAAAIDASSPRPCEPLSPCSLQFQHASGSDLTAPVSLSEVSDPSDGAPLPPANGDHLAPFSTFEECVCRQGPEQSQEFETDDVGHEAAKEALRDSIRGIYRLWKTQRWNLVHGRHEAKKQRDEKELFLRIVQESVDSC